MVSIGIKTRSFQTLCDKGKKENILEDSATQNDSVQFFIGSDRLTGLDDNAGDGLMELS